MDDLLIFCGDAVGTRTLEFLIGIDQPIDLIVLTRDTPEIVELARANGIKLLNYHADPTVLSRVEGRKFRWLLNLWSSVFLSSKILETAEHRLNIHPGIVPETRGSDCASWAIRCGLPAGVSLLEMTAELDAGDVYAKTELDVEFHTSGGELQDRLKAACVELFMREWTAIRDGKVIPVPQGDAVRSFKRTDTSDDRVRDLDKDDATYEVIKWMLAHDFAPSSRPRVQFGGKSYERHDPARRNH